MVKHCFQAYDFMKSVQPGVNIFIIVDWIIVRSNRVTLEKFYCNLNPVHYGLNRSLTFLHNTMGIIVFTLYMVFFCWGNTTWQSLLTINQQNQQESIAPSFICNNCNSDISGTYQAFWVYSSKKKNKNYM